MVYPTEQICLTVDQGEIAKTGKMYNQLHKLTGWMYEMDACIQTRFPQEMLGKSREEQIHSVLSSCFREN